MASLTKACRVLHSSIMGEWYIESISASHTSKLCFNGSNINTLNFQSLLLFLQVVYCACLVIFLCLGLKFLCGIPLKFCHSDGRQDSHMLVGTTAFVALSNGYFCRAPRPSPWARRPWPSLKPALKGTCNKRLRASH